MPQQITQFALVVADYDEALAFYVGVLGFEKVEDTDLGSGKRWVRVRPAGSTGAGLLLARAVTDEQRLAIGRQAGGRVFVFLETDDLRRDHAALNLARGAIRSRPKRGDLRRRGGVRGPLWQSIRSDRTPVA